MFTDRLRRQPRVFAERVILVRQAQGKQMLPDGPQFLGRLAAAFCGLSRK